MDLLAFAAKDLGDVLKALRVLQPERGRLVSDRPEVALPAEHELTLLGRRASDLPPAASFSRQL